MFTGLSVRTIQRIESGHNASLETLKALASVFEIDIAQLTEEITVIDKSSEHWQAQPWWFRAWAWGVGSRKVQVWLEYLILALVVIFSAASYFDGVYIKYTLFLMYILYIQAACIRYGDNNKAWGYAK